MSLPPASMSSDVVQSDQDFRALEAVWREYQYRHDLCWRAVYKVTFAVIVLGVIPYPEVKLTRSLGEFVVAPPLVGTLLAAFGIFLVWSELEHFARVALAYHTLQNRFWDRVLSGTNVLDSVKLRMTSADVSRMPFDFFVMSYMIVLFLLSAANSLFVACCWEVPPTPLGGR